MKHGAITRNCFCADCKHTDRRQCIDAECECCGETYRHDGFMESNGVQGESRLTDWGRRD